MRIAAEGLRDDLFKLRFDLVYVLARSKARPVADAEDMGVNGKCFLAERCVQDNIGSLPANAGERLKLIARPRNLAVMPIEEGLAQGDDILRLCVEQPNGLDGVPQPVLAKINHLLRGLDMLEQGLRREVHARVCGLGR